MFVQANDLCNTLILRFNHSLQKDISELLVSGAAFGSNFTSGAASLLLPPEIFDVEFAGSIGIAFFRILNSSSVSCY